MKKIILIFCILFQQRIVSAQKLIKLTATGFVSVADTTKDYIVVDVPGTTAKNSMIGCEPKLYKTQFRQKIFLARTRKVLRSRSIRILNLQEWGVTTD